MMTEELSRNLAVIAAMNNTGAMRLDQQDYQGAIEHFKHALRASKMMIQDLSEMACGATQPSSMLPQSCIEDWMQQISSSDYSFDPMGKFVYNHVVVIPPMMNLDVRHEGIDMMIVADDWLNLSCIAIIFNLALAYQAIAIKTSKRAFAMKALQLFEHAIGLQNNHMRENPRAASSSSGSLFLLAALNNVGYLHQALGHRQESDSFSYRIISILMYTVVAGGDTSQYKDFFKNVTRLIHPACAECAGAA